MKIQSRKQKQNEAAKPKPLAIDIDGDTLNITYRPAVLLAGEIGDLADLAQSLARSAEGADETQTPEQSALLMRALASQEDQFFRRVASWDLTDDEVPVPLTREGLAAAEVDVQMMTLILAAIARAESPNAKTAPTSASS